jgi:fatty acid/phospholipid biosynthesis enzyme
MAHSLIEDFDINKTKNHLRITRSIVKRGYNQFTISAGNTGVAYVMTKLTSFFGNP